MLASVFNCSFRRRLVRHFRIGAAHHSGNCNRALRVRDHQHLGRQLAHLPVERLDLLAGPCRPHDDLRTTEFREVEGVHRLPHFEQHVVGDVDDVADRPDARRLQPRLHPGR